MNTRVRRIAPIVSGVRLAMAPLVRVMSSSFFRTFGNLWIVATIFTVVLSLCNSKFSFLMLGAVYAQVISNIIWLGCPLIRMRSACKQRERGNYAEYVEKITVLGIVKISPSGTLVLLFVLFMWTTFISWWIYS